MNEVRTLLERQARWQKSRKALSWPEKIHVAEQVRSLAGRWRSIAGKNAVAGRKSKDALP